MKATAAIWIVVMLSPCLSRAGKNMPATKIKSLLRQVESAYAAMKTFQCTGLTINTRKRSDRVPFEIYFRRPGHLRYEWTTFFTGTRNKHIIWTMGGEVSLYEKTPFLLEKKPNIRAAVAKAMRTTYGGVQIVPSLLDPKNGNFVPSRLLNPKYLGKEMVEGTECHIITGLQLNKKPMKLWVSTNGFLLKKVQIGPVLHFFRGMEVDAPLSDKIFDFKPTTK